MSDKIDKNDIYADLQDHYIHMTPEQLLEAFEKGAENVWKDIFDLETQKTLLKKILYHKEIISIFEKLTELEKDVIVAIAENQYADFPDSWVWSWAIDYETKITKKEQISGVVSSLVKKELAITEDYAGDNTIKLTVKGVAEYKQIKEEK